MKAITIFFTDLLIRLTRIFSQANDARLMIDGRIVNITNLQEEDIDKDIILLGACRINRFLGQTKYPYPVASHLIGGWMYLDDIGADILLKKQWLIHEAFESYSGVDLPSPFKSILPDYKKAEKKALKVISKFFGVNPAESSEIKKIDNAIMITEALVLAKNKAYWNQIAKENDIEPLSDKYVLEYMHEAKLRATLEDIWNETFGDKR